MNWDNIPADHPTPSLVVCAETARANIRGMQNYCNTNHLALRPHTKTHKSIKLAKEQMNAGAAGLTVAKVGEAEKMANASDDIMIAYPAIGFQRLKRLTSLARSTRLRIGIDSMLAAEILQSAAFSSDVKLDILVDIDVGFHRTGVMDPSAAVKLCEFIDQQSQLRVIGLMCFPGHILPSADEKAWQEYSQSLENVASQLQRKGVCVDTISGGSTPTAKLSHRNPLLTEIRPGTYVYNDMNEVRLGVCEIDDCAARVLTTVVSTPEPTKFIVDAGSKTLSSDRNAANPDAGFGFVVEYPEARITRLSEEHGEIVLPNEATSKKPLPKIGDRVSIIPNHICVCVNLQNEFYWLESDGLHSLPVDARGLLV